MHKPNGRQPDSDAGIVIIGAGPAGLSAAYELSRHHVQSTVLEADSVVGGLAQTAEYKGYLFDIGGHRFFTKVSLVDRMWHEILGPDFLSRPRLSRIYYNSRFFQYPLEPMNALRGLGIFEAIRCGLSYAWAKVKPQEPESNFEAWVSNRFGRRLYGIFFKAYTEKVWGIPCREIDAEWAAQRIRGLSLTSVVWNALRRKRRQDKKSVIKTLIHEFNYPRRGPGMMWTRTRDLIEERGSRVVMNSPVEKIYWEPGRVTAVKAGGRVYRGHHFISSMPIRQLIRCLEPAPPAYLAEAAVDFHYRDFLTVCLICKGTDLFPDNWIYIHDPNVRVGRIQNYSNWSPEMVPDASTSCLGMEYFCFEGDDLWNTPDNRLLEMARQEVAQLGLVRPEAVIDGTVLRVPKAYPVYDATYQRGLAAIKRFISSISNLQLVGRNGMHRYNNQDHSILTAVLAARNVLGAKYDLWQVNADQEYSEEGQMVTEHELKAMEAAQPLVPRRTAVVAAGAGSRTSDAVPAP
jgi:protoporphyrinogen oxidase